MKNYEEGKYKIAIIQEEHTYFIENAVTTMSWNGNKSEASRTLNLEVLIVGNKTDFEIGSVIIIYSTATKKELMRYIIIKKVKNGKAITIKYMARDIRWWLTKNKMDKKFENMTASEIFLNLCKILEIETGRIDDTKVKFSSLYFTGKTAWDIIITALTETRKLTGKKFITKIENGKIELVEKLTQTSKVILEEGRNLLESNYEKSIENIYTQVSVSGKTESGNTITAVKKNEEKQKKYGIIQEYISQNDKVTQIEINTIATQKLKELSQLQKSGTIKALGIDGIETGSAIYVIDSATGLIGSFYIESDTHTYSNGYHEMSLTLAWTDELPAIDYEAKEE